MALKSARDIPLVSDFDGVEVFFFAMLQIITYMWYSLGTPVGMTANRFSFQGCAPFAGCGAYPRERGSTPMLDVGEQRKQRHMFKFWCRLKEFGYGDLSFRGRTVGGALLCLSLLVL